MFPSIIDKNIFLTDELRASADCLLLRFDALDVDDNGNADRYHILSALNEINMLSWTLKKHKVGVNAIVIRAASIAHHIKENGGAIADYTKITHNNLILYAKVL